MILTYGEFLLEKSQVKEGDLILEGGAAGHMPHPFDYNDLTFADFRTIVTGGLKGELNFEEVAVEKTDGQNFFATVKDGIAMFSRNKGQLVAPLDLAGIVDAFADHAVEKVRQIFTLAAQDLDKALPNIKNSKEIFRNGTSWINMELIWTQNPNVINYDRDVIQFHNMNHTDGQGIITDTDSKPAKELVGILKKIGAHQQKTFNIIPPQVIKLMKNVDFEKRQQYYFSKIDKLRDQYGLDESDEVKMYHEAWWRNQVEENFGDLTADLKEGLFLRWAYSDKQTLNMVAIKKMADADQLKKIKEFDKIRQKKYKENILPFENLFLELGADVLMNASNFVAANPELEKTKLHAKIRKAAQDVKLNGNLAQVAKIEAELQRLEGIGGIESIVPTEGIVFKYRGKIMKLTGTFAAINQLMGIIKYGR
jgi:hypothetical protein